MATITRDDLLAMRRAETLRQQDNTIAMYVNAISYDVVSCNNQGKSTCTKVLYQETDYVKTQVMKQLQSVFIDSNIVYSETDQSITMDWTAD